MSFLELFKLEKDKLANSGLLPSKPKTKNVKWEGGCSGYGWFVSSGRERDLSLDLRAIRPSKFVGTRSKAALRIETYAWAPVSGVFDKLREVGDLSYLGFTLYLSVLSCFGWFEALNGRLIGSKTWNRNEKIMEPNEMAVIVCVLWGLFEGVNGINCVTNCIVICIRLEMAVKFGFTK